MKPLTQKKELNAQKDNTQKQTEKKETKSTAQCCAKVSKIIAGCHD